MKPTLPGFGNLPVTKPNKKPIHEQLEDLKNEHQNPYVKAAQQNLNAGGYVEKEQRIYESLRVPGYETYEKSDASYKKLKENENNIDYNSTTGKIFDAWKNDPNVRMPQKDLVSQIQKDKTADSWSGPSHRGPSYDHSARTLQQEQDLGTKMWLAKQKEKKLADKKLIKWALEESPEAIVKNPILKKVIDDQPLPAGLGNKYKSDIRTANAKKKDAYDEKKYGIKQRVKNTKGPHIAELIYKGMTPHEKGSHNAEQRRNKLDNHFDSKNIKPVKITEYPEVALGSAPEVSQTKINKVERPVEQIVKELANERLVHEQRDWDRRYGKGGITSLKRPE